MNRMRSLLVALILAIGLGMAATTPPAPMPEDGPRGQFAAGRAMIDIRAVAAKPHITGSRENAEVRAYLIRRMREMGMLVTTEQGVVDARGTEKRNKWTGRNDPPVTLTNIIGVMSGQDRNAPAVLLMAHHDSVWGSPGAPDDSAGVAAALEVARAIRARGGARADLIVLLTDAEELGLQGARLFFAANPLRQRVGAVINMEARGGGGRTTLFQTSHDNGEAIRAYAQAVQRPGASSLAAFVYSVLPNDSDLTPVIAGPYTAYNFAFIGRSGQYHSPLATPERLDQGALQDMGDQVLALSAALLAADALPGKAPNTVFFDLFGLTTVTYPAWLGWVLLGLSCLGAGVVVWREGPAGAWGGAARMSGVLILSAALLYGLNQLSLGLLPSNYYDRLAAIPLLEVMAALGGASAAIAVFAGWQRSAGGVLGAMAPLALLALVAQGLAPTAAYILILPIVLVTLVLVLRTLGTAATGRLADTAISLLLLGLILLGLGEFARQALGWPAWLVVGVLIAGVMLLRNPGALSFTHWAVPATVGGYMIALGHQLIQGVGPTMPWAAALPLCLGLVTVLPIWPLFDAKRGRMLALGLALAAGGVALWIQLDPPAASRAVYSDNKK